MGKLSKFCYQYIFLLKRSGFNQVTKAKSGQPALWACLIHKSPLDSFPGVYGRAEMFNMEWQLFVQICVNTSLFISAINSSSFEVLSEKLCYKSCQTLIKKKIEREQKKLS